MKHLVIFYAVLFSGVAFTTPDKICVRSYIKDPAIKWDPCEHLKTHLYAIPLEPTERKICTRAYSAFYCETASKEYVWIHSPDGKRFCTLDYNQPGVVNYCESVSQYYDYVKNN